MKLFRNEKGMTLVELLAALALGSLIIIFIMSIQILVQKQYNTQKDSAQELTDITIAVKAITKEIRFAGGGSVTVVEDEKLIKIKEVEGKETEYRFENGMLLKDDSPYLYNVESFEVTKAGNKITLKIKNTSGEEFNTEIIIR